MSRRGERRLGVLYDSLDPEQTRPSLVGVAYRRYHVNLPAMQFICFRERCVCKMVGCVFERNGIFDLCALASEALEKFCGNAWNTSQSFSGSVDVLKSQGPLSWLFGGRGKGRLGGGAPVSQNWVQERILATPPLS